MRKKEKNFGYAKNILGIDTIEFKVENGDKKASFSLFDAEGNEYAKYANGKLAIILPIAFHGQNNLIPYQNTQDPEWDLAILSTKINDELKQKFSYIPTFSLKKAEISYISQNESIKTISDICLFLAKAFSMEDKDNQCKLFMNKIHNETYMTGFVSPQIKKNYFYLKVYNKGRELRLNEDHLRIEIVLLSRVFNKSSQVIADTTLDNILTVDTLQKIQHLTIPYRDCIRKIIRAYLNETLDRLYKFMLDTDPEIACIRMKEDIAFAEIIKKALDKYEKAGLISSSVKSKKKSKIIEKLQLNNSVYDALKLFINEF